MHDAFSRDIREGQRVAFSLKGEPGLIHGKVAGVTPVEILAVASHQGRVRQFKLRAQDVVIHPDDVHLLPPRKGPPRIT